ncbi:MAG: hypothetical protein GY841_08840 [FCB group bacterium]|nr:hypothetical protein [FCB group bacterium]
MTLKKSLYLLFFLSMIIVIVSAGCSDGTFTSSTTEISEQASPLAYIPLEQGLRIDYALMEDEGISYYESEITNPVTIVNSEGFEIRRIDRSKNETSVMYRYVKGNAIFESSSTNDPGYKILEGPFVVGHTWNRYEETTSTETTIIANGDNGNDGFDIKGVTITGRNYKVLPDGEYGNMTIVGYEDVRAMNGTNYGQCLKVSWNTDPLHTNYYWYSSGIGLVKFEQRINTINSTEESVSIIMTDYQIVEY